MTRVCFFIILITVCGCSSIKLNKGITWKYAKCSENVVREVTYTYNEDSIKIPFLNHPLPKKKLDSICIQALVENKETVELQGKSRLFLFHEFSYRDSFVTMSVVQINEYNKSSYTYLLYVWNLPTSFSEFSCYMITYSPDYGAVYAKYGNVDNNKFAKVIKYHHLSKRKWSDTYQEITKPYLKIECF